MKNKYFVKIGGIYCDHCRQTISKELLKINGIDEVSICGNIAAFEYSGEPEKIDCVADRVNALGYATKREWICKDFNKWKLQQIFALFYVAVIFLSFRCMLKAILGYDILNVIPAVDIGAALGTLFMAGLATSLHCIGMCGAINLAASAKKKNALLYNAGRVLCYTLVGTAAGSVGSVLSFNRTALYIFTVAVSSAMLLMGIGMTGLFSVKSRGLCEIKIKSKNAFVLGVLNGFMPCAPLTAMQLYAVSAANPFIGGLSMLLFGLGTLPLMLGFGFIRSIFEKKKEQIQKIMAVFVILLALSMMFRGLSALGINFRLADSQLANYNVAEIYEDEQIVEMDLTYSSFGDIAVKKGIPVTFIINADEKNITGCNNAVISMDFNESLMASKNVITFTPTEAGIYTYSCWMNMIKNTIYVYE